MALLSMPLQKSTQRTKENGETEANAPKKKESKVKLRAVNGKEISD